MGVIAEEAQCGTISGKFLSQGERQAMQTPGGCYEVLSATVFP